MGSCGLRSTQKPLVKAADHTASFDVNEREQTKSSLDGFGQKEQTKNLNEEVNPISSSDATSLISRIRREEFGIDLAAVDEAMEQMMQRQRFRLKRAVKRLAEDLYADKSHLLLELIQNADDNHYSSTVVPTLKFILGEQGLCVVNNERGFCEMDVRAICDVGMSAKVVQKQKSNSRQTSTRIGKFGVGFKSVFRISGSPHIFSNQFRIKFDENDPSGLGHLLPHCLPDGSWTEHCPNDIRDAILASEINPSTVIWLPFRASAHFPNSLDAVIESVQSVSPNWLLFLNRLKDITTIDLIHHFHCRVRRVIYSPSDLPIKHEKLCSLLEDVPNVRLISLQSLTSSFPKPASANKMIESFQLQFSSPSDSSIIVSFPINLDSNSVLPDIPHESYPIFAYLPIRSIGFKFGIQANFNLAASREEILRSVSLRSYITRTNSI